MTSRSAAGAVVVCAFYLASCGQTTPGDPAQSLDVRLAAAHDVQVTSGPKAAVALYDAIIATSRESHDRRHEALALGQLGVAYKNLGEYDRAMDLQQQAITLKRALGDEIEIGKTLTNIGLIEDARGNCGRALELYGESLEIFTRLKLPRFQASVLNNQGLCYDALGDYQRSRETYQRSLAFHRDAGNDLGQSEALGNLGGVALLLGQYAEAANDYEQSLAISTRLDAKQSMALDLINLGLARGRLGELGVARGHLEQARKIAHDAGLLREEADALRDLGNLLAESGHYEEARKMVEAAGASYAQAGLPRERVDATQSLGAMDLRTGDLTRAASAFGSSAAEAATLHYAAGQVSADLALAELDLRRQNPEAAVTRLERARTTAGAAGDQASTASALTFLARARLAQGRQDLAAAAARAGVDSAAATRSPIMLADARIVLGDVLVAGKTPAEARVQYDAVLSDETAVAIPDLAWRAAFGRGRSSEAAGRPEDALSDYLRAVNVIEQVRSELVTETSRTGFLDDKRDVYLALVRVLLRMGRTKEAFQAAERLRAQAYRDLVERSMALGTSQTGIPSSLLARIRQLQAAVDEELRRPVAEQRGQAVALYRSELRDAEQAWSAAVEALADHTPLGRALRPDVPVAIRQIQRRLTQGTALIEYVVAHHEATAFLLTGGSVRAYLLPVGVPELRTRVELFRGLLARQEAESWQPLATRLDAELIDPVRRAGGLKAVTRLYIVPHGDLNYLPFAALRHESAQGPRTLIDDTSVVILPAAAALTESPERPLPGGSLLAMSPSRTGLKYSQDEVRSIEPLFQGPRVFLGADATEERFKQDAAHFRVLHLATHGFFNRVNPLFSGVDLEPSAHEDGRLQVFEILGLPLAADLVTLSACDTALGTGELSDLPAGEELIGLTRAFLSAGSNNVLATLWEIDDRATASLMAEFYRAARTRPFPEALAAIQRERAHSTGADGLPWHWAAFTIAEGWEPRPDGRVTGP